MTLDPYKSKSKKKILKPDVLLREEVHALLGLHAAAHGAAGDADAAQEKGQVADLKKLFSFLSNPVLMQSVCHLILFYNDRFV